MSNISRAYQTEGDYALMRQLTVSIIEQVGLPAYATVGDLDWWRFADDDPSADVRGANLWLNAAGHLCAFAWPSADQVDIFVHPDQPSLHDEAIAWAENYYRLNQPEASRVPLRVWGFTSDTPRNSALQARGYQRTDGCLVYYVQPLVAPIAVPPLPHGYTFAAVRSEADIAARAAVQRAAFESEFMTVAKQQAVMSSPTYRPDLDAVIRAPDGTFAAFAQVWLDETNHLGVFEPVGVATAHQQRGLGRAVMLEGLRRLQALGAHRAVVQTGPQNDAARNLYESVGFQELDRCYAWVRSEPA